MGISIWKEYVLLYPCLIQKQGIVDNNLIYQNECIQRGERDAYGIFF